MKYMKTLRRGVRGIGKIARKVHAGERLMNLGINTLGAYAASRPYVGSGRYRRYAGRGMYTGKFRGRGMYTGGWRGRGLYTGRGLYGVNRNFGGATNHLIGKGHNAQPRFASKVDETGALRITHSEYITDVYANDSNTVFQNHNLQINPGIAKTFPWLSQIAANYEEYQLIQCIMSFQSSVSDQIDNSNGQIGEIIMYTDYGADSKPKPSKLQLLQAYGANSAVITNDVAHGIECDPKKIHGDGHKFIRTTALDNHQNLNDYDHGLFQYAINGTPGGLANQIVGQLFVAYTVVLRKPRLYSSLGYAIQKDVFLAAKTAEDDTWGVEGGGLFRPNDIVGAENLIRASNNTIGCRVRLAQKGAASPAAKPKVDIIFPASFSGAVEIIYHVESATTGATDWGNNSGFGLPPELDGNVLPIKDMRAADTNLVGADKFEPDFYTSTGSIYARIGIIHVQVQQANTGTDNRVTIVGLTPVAGEEPVNSAYLEIKTYNSWQSLEEPTYVGPNGQTYTFYNQK